MLLLVVLVRGLLLLLCLSVSVYVYAWMCVCLSVSVYVCAWMCVCLSVSLCVCVSKGYLCTVIIQYLTTYADNSLAIQMKMCARNGPHCFNTRLALARHSLNLITYCMPTRCQRYDNVMCILYLVL